MPLQPSCGQAAARLYARSSPPSLAVMAFEDAALVAQQQELGLISGAVAEGSVGEVDEES